MDRRAQIAPVQAYRNSARSLVVALCSSSSSLTRGGILVVSRCRRVVHNDVLICVPPPGATAAAGVQRLHEWGVLADSWCLHRCLDSLVIALQVSDASSELVYCLIGGGRGVKA